MTKEPFDQKSGESLKHIAHYLGWQFLDDGKSARAISRTEYPRLELLYVYTIAHKGGCASCIEAVVYVGEESWLAVSKIAKPNIVEYGVFEPNGKREAYIYNDFGTFVLSNRREPFLFCTYLAASKIEDKDRDD